MTQLLTGFAAPQLKVYDLAYSEKGKVRFTRDEVQAVVPVTYPATTGTRAAQETLYVTVFLFNGHQFNLKAEYEDELLSCVE